MNNEIIEIIKDKGPAVAGVIAATTVLYMGGKWLYRKAKKSGEKTTEQKETKTEHKENGTSEETVEAIKPLSEKDTAYEKDYSKIFDTIENLVVFDKKFNNGTGYFDSAAEAEFPEIEVNQFFKMVDPMTNRRIIGYKMSQGKNVIIFERYTMGHSSTFTVVSNLPHGVRIEGFGSAIKHEVFMNFIKNQHG